MFRRRRRDGDDGAEREPAAVSYPEADDELSEDEYLDDYDEPAATDVEEADLGADSDTQEEYEAAGDPDRHDLGDPETWTRLRDSAASDQESEGPAGPWDSAGGYPEAERLDFGCLLVPVKDGFDVQVLFSDDQGVSVAVVSGDSGLQLQPFAAPRTSGLWHEVRHEIAAEVAKAGGQSREQDGPFGSELLARVAPQQPGGPPLPPQPLRFLGVDGPRWFLRGLISGPAAMDPRLARPFEELFAGVVVVRGEHAEPPRKPLDVVLPEEARQALESQFEAQNQGMPNPFERGPEITETR